MRCAKHIYYKYKHQSIMNKNSTSNSEPYSVPFDEEDIRDIHQKYNHEEFIEMLNDDVANRGLGCLFGSMIGDSLGAYCEFEKQITPSILEKTMQMNGGGTFKLRAGQFTDDSELAYHLLEGLTSYTPFSTLSSQINSIVDQIALGYMKWEESNPFDIGITTRKGIQSLRSYRQHIQQQSLTKELRSQMYEDILKAAGKSQSNGSLMRIPPMALFLGLLKVEQSDRQKINLLINNEIRLLHPNQRLIDAGNLWVKMLISLINRKDDSQQQLKKTFNIIEIKCKSKGLGDWIAQTHKLDPLQANTSSMGWARIAWSYGLRYLKCFSQKEQNKFDENTFKTVVQEVISRGGDTDTNAAIVGGMMGALVGFKRLPRQYLRTMMKLRFPSKRKTMTDRPQNYEPRYSLARALYLIRNIWIANKAKI